MTRQVQSSAVISECGKYRYHLCRWWGPGPRAVFVMLNPSKADASINDPTVVRCMGFAEAWGLDGIDIVNLYAWRETKPQLLWTAQSIGINIIGPSNDTFLTVLAGQAVNRGLLIAAWGANAEPKRVDQVMRLPYFDRMKHLGLTKSGMPRHPLYLPRDSVPQPFLWRAA